MGGGSPKQSLLLFDDKGKFLNKIGRKGKGPNEYYSLNSLWVDKDNEIIYIMSGDRNIVEYNLDGDLIKKTKVEYYPGQAIFYEGNILFHFRPNSIGDNDNFEFLLIDTEYKEIKKAVPGTFYQSAISSGKLYFANNTLRFWNNLNQDTIYNMNKDLELSPKYFMEYPNKMPHEYYLDIMKSNEHIDLSRISSIYETDNYMLVSGIYNRKMTQLLYDFKQKKSFGIELNEQWEWRFNSRNGFINDIDGGMKFWHRGRIDDNTLFAFYDIIDIRDYIDERNKLIEAGEYEDFEIKFPEKQKDLEDMLENSNDEDNPVIMIVELK